MASVHVESIQEAPSKLIEETADRNNLLLLINLRWLAIFGQLCAIGVSIVWLHATLPLGPMLGVLACLTAFNLFKLLRHRSGAEVTNIELFFDLILDVLALTAQLYFSGGASNPFISLFLLQVILGGVLLKPWSTWVIVAITSACFLALIEVRTPESLAVLMHEHKPVSAFDIHIYGMFVCFALASVILVMFVTRINENVRDKDARLAELRQHSAEEDSIVRMGLLASGAAHELGTPLATLSVILNDWQKMPSFAQDAELSFEISEMQAQLRRCKEIVSGILRSSGQERGEESHRSGIIRFMDDVVGEWEDRRAPLDLRYVNRLDDEFAIVSDPLLRQVVINVLDNAYEASPSGIGVDVSLAGDELIVAVEDNGPGFSQEMLAAFGKPYRSTKGAPGAGLGLFLVANVLRKLGGRALPRNKPGSGAIVELRIPVASLTV